MEEMFGKLRTQIEDWEKKLEEKGDMRMRIEDWKTKRDAVMKRLEAMRATKGDRIDVMKMGIESAWEELKAAFETATAEKIEGKQEGEKKDEKAA